MVDHLSMDDAWGPFYRNWTAPGNWTKFRHQQRIIPIKNWLRIPRRINQWDWDVPPCFWGFVGSSHHLISQPYPEMNELYPPYVVG